MLDGQPYDALWQARLGDKQRASLVNRFLYELGGNAGLGVFTRRAAHGDFGRWHRFPAWKRLLAPWIERAWRRGDRCRHHLPEHWCRPPRGQQVEETPRLGEIQPRV